jgi:hypothetical protein
MNTTSINADALPRDRPGHYTQMLTTLTPSRGMLSWYYAMRRTADQDGWTKSNATITCASTTPQLCSLDSSAAAEGRPLSVTKRKVGTSTVT